MSKKDYIAIANVIKDVRNTTKHIDGINAINDIENRLIRLFGLDNDNFNGGRFWDYVHSDKRYKDFTDR